MEKGIFISLEGVDCAGKSTLAQGLMERFSGRDVRLFKFPSTGAYGTQAKEILFSDSYSADEYMMLCLLDMKSTYDKEIKPALDEGAIVICDRYVHSTAAYQSKMLKRAKAVFASSIATVAFRLLGLPLPDITFLINMPYDLTMSRLKQKADQDSIEQGMSRKLVVSITRSYLRMMDQEKYGDMVALNGSESPEMLVHEASRFIEKKLLGFDL